MKKALFALFLFIGFCSNSAKAQDSLSIGGGGVLYNFDDSVFYYDTVSYYIWVKNIGSNQFSGQIQMLTMVDTGSGPAVADTATFTIVLNTNDSLPLSFNETYTPQNYRIGGNIVVIWPAFSPNYYFSNYSNPHPLWVYGYLSNGEESPPGRVTVFPNPFSDRLSIVLNDPTRTISAVKIRDLAGKMVFVSKQEDEIYDTSCLIAGLYIAEISFSDGSVAFVKVAKAVK